MARDEGIGGAMASKIHNVLAFYKDLRGLDNAIVNYHDTILYNSIYRFDDEMLVNTHLFGTPPRTRRSCIFDGLPAGSCSTTTGRASTRSSRTLGRSGRKTSGKLELWPDWSISTTPTRRRRTASSWR